MTNTFHDTMHAVVLQRVAGAPEAYRGASELQRDQKDKGRREPLWPHGEVVVAVVLLALTVWHFMPLPHRVEVENTSASPLHGVVLRVGDEDVAAGDLAPGQRFWHTAFMRRRLGSTIEASALVDGSRTSLGRCDGGILSAMHTRIALHGGAIDDGRDCRTEQPRIGFLP